MVALIQKIIAWLRRLLNALIEAVFEEDKTSPHELKAEQTARAVELGLASAEAPLYRKSKSVLTWRERVLLRSIRQATAGEYTILMKVRMGDFVWLANEPQDRKYHSNQVLCKHVDFLLCDKISVEPLLVIELDDNSHKQADHAERDRFKDETFDAIGLPFLRIALQEKYDAEGLKKQIREKIGERPLFTPAS